MMKQDKPRISVIVPVYNDENRISKCIQSLLNQTYNKNFYEILIVDNGSTDRTRTVVNRYPVKILVEAKKRSSYAARNKGVRYANNEILAFTDSDAIADKNWLENGVKALSVLIHSNKRKIVVGIVKPLDNPYLNIFSLYDYITAFRHELKTWNLFVYKKDFNKIGFFNEKLISGGDVNWGVKAIKNGFNIKKAKNVIIYHPLRSSFNSLLKKQFRVGYGSGQLLRDYYKNFHSEYFIMKEILKEPIRIKFWITSTIKIIYKYLKNEKIGFSYFLPLIFIVLIFCFTTSFSRLRGFLGKKFKLFLVH